MRQTVLEAVVGEPVIGGDDGGIQRRGRVRVVLDVQDHRPVEQGEELIGGFLAIHERHTPPSDIPAGILDEPELILDGREIGTQRAREPDPASPDQARPCR